MIFIGFEGIVMVTQDREQGVPSEPPKVLYRQFLLRGFTPKQAANLVAYMEGLDVRDTQWTLKEIETMLFLKALADMDKIKK